MTDTAIEVVDIAKRYRIGTRREAYRTVRESLTQGMMAPWKRLVRGANDRSRSRPVDHTWALDGVSFKVNAGEIVGIIGRNGAGKTTLLKVLSRITEPTRGFAEVHGRVGSLLEVGTGFHPELTGRENIYLNGVILGMKRREIAQKFDEIVAFAEVEKFIDTPVKRYSSGMHMRLAFAVAAHLEPEILLVDEVLAVGDVLFQKKCLGKMGDVAREGRTVLFVSHNMGAIRSICKQGIFLDEGKVGYLGPIPNAIEAYFRAIGALQPQGDPTQSDGRSCFGPIVLDGGQGNTVSQSGPFELATTFRVADEVGGFSLNCILEDMHGRRIFRLRTDHAELGCRVEPGEVCEVRVTIPPLWLVPGLYSVYFKVKFRGKFGRCKHVSDRFPVDVDGSTGVSDCVLHPGVRWSAGSVAKRQ